ncbi:MAG: hypothetical protein GY765_17030 [bacterium]|nr:hypothetical protein [bacterium]
MRKKMMVITMCMMLFVPVLLAAAGDGPKNDAMEMESEAFRFEVTRTMKDMRMISRALRNYITDNKRAPHVNTMEEVAKAIQPFYIKTCPLTDVWGGKLLYKYDPQNPKAYLLASAGSDGRFAGYPQKGTWSNASVRTGGDLIYDGKSFVYGPAPFKKTGPDKEEKQDVEAEKAAITKVIRQAFIEGAVSRADEKAVKKGYHSRGRMFDFRYTDIKSYSRADWIKRMKTIPPMPGVEHRIKVLSVTGYAASALVEVLKDKKLFIVEHMSLYKLKGGWKIIGSLIYSPAYKIPRPRRAIHIDPASLDAFCGKYVLGPRFYFNVKKKKNHLLVETSRQDPLEVFPETPVTFFSRQLGVTFTFLKDASGKVTQLIGRFGGKEYIARRTTPRVSVFPGGSSDRKSLKWQMKEVEAGPFRSRKDALQPYGDRLPGHLELARESRKPGGRFYVLKKEPLGTGNDVEGVSVDKRVPGGAGIAFTFTDDGAARFRKYSSANKGKKIAHLLSGRVVFAAEINGVFSKHAVIAGRFSKDEAMRFCTDFRAARDKGRPFILKSLDIMAVVGEPFKTKKEALEKYGADIGGKYLLKASDPDRLPRRYYVLKKEVIVSLKDFRSVTRSRGGGDIRGIAFSLDDAGAGRMKAHSSANIGSRLAVLLNGRVISAPKLQGVVFRDGVIHGRFSAKEIEEIIVRIKLFIAKQKQ